MHGDLRTTSLEQLCRGLDARTASGRLIIEGPSGAITVWFRQGRVARAAAEGHELRLGDRLVHGGLLTPEQLHEALAMQKDSGRQLGEVLVDEGLANRLVVRVFMQEQVLDALFAAVRWSTGTYTFEEEEVAGAAVPTDLTVSQLLYALETRHRVWDEITRTIPTLDAVPELVPGADVSQAPLEPGESAILTRIDGRRSIADITEELGFGEYEVAGVVHGLSVLGLVRLTTSASPSTNGSGQANGHPATAHVATEADAARAPWEPAEASSDAPAASAIAEAAALLRGDADDEPASWSFGIDDEAEDEAPISRYRLDEPEPNRVSPPADPVAAEPVPAPPPAPAAMDPAPMPSASFDDTDPEPWAFVIEDDDDPSEPEQRAPRRQPSRPITAVVADPATGTPLPTPTPAPGPAATTQEQAPPSRERQEPPSRPRTGEMSDLLRELRQLSDE